MKDRLNKLASMCWSHKAMYLGLSLAYGGVCLGWVDKSTANEVAFGCYLALWAQRH
ncbi:MAG: hypothetical protein AAF092_06480 [Pseudomonadota bacterium]